MDNYRVIENDQWSDNSIYLAKWIYTEENLKPYKHFNAYNHVEFVQLK